VIWGTEKEVDESDVVLPMAKSKNVGFLPSDVICYPPHSTSYKRFGSYRIEKRVWA